MDTIRNRHRTHTIGTALACVVVAGAIAGSLVASESDGPVRNLEPDAATVVFRSVSLPVRVEHRYRMLGRVRPLLFWISRDDIGEAQVTWREAGNGVGYELLIGSDPERAPRRINRWGYIGEERKGSDARVFGVMKQSNEESLSEAEAHIASEGRQSGHVFKAIQSWTTLESSEARVLTIRSDRDLTFRDIDPLMNLIAASGHDAVIRRVALPAGAQPGFLTALADLIHRSVDAHRRQPVTSLPTPSALYVYNGGLHDLTVRSSRLVRSVQSGGHQYRDVIESSFDSKSRASGLVTRFQIAYGTTGSLAEIPVHAVYQPRWWLEVQLFLDDKKDS